MPQPLNRVRVDAGIAFGPGFLEQRPEFAKMIAVIIGEYSYIEVQFSFIYYRVIGANSAVAFEIFRTSHARRQALTMIEAAAKHSITSSENEILSKVISKFKTAAKKRDVLAHCLWGVSDQLPDAILMIQQESYHRVAVALESYVASDRPIRLNEIRFNPDDIMVYRRSDLERELKLIRFVHDIMSQTVGALSLAEDSLRREKFAKIGNLISLDS